MSILAGTQHSDGGEFLLDGENLFRNAKRLAEVVGYVPQGTPLIEELSAWDNLLLWYDAKMLRRELDGGVLKMLGIDEFISVPVRKMSGGMKKRLSIGCSVAKKPSLLLLDEPCAALDLICKHSINEYLRSFKANGGSLILATHDESELSLCDVIYILKDGKLHNYDYGVNSTIGKGTVFWFVIKDRKNDTSV
jgi:ABC-2 type transport system ATP-binding protein